MGELGHQLSELITWRKKLADLFRYIALHVSPHIQKRQVWTGMVRADSQTSSALPNRDHSDLYITGDASQRS